MTSLFPIVIPSLISSIGWGLTPILEKINLKLVDNDHMIVFFIHLIFIGLLALTLGLFYTQKIKSLFSNPNLKNIMLVGFLGSFSAVFLGYYFYFRALAKSNSTLLVILVVYILPLLVVSILSKIILKEELNIGMISGLIISIMGIIIFGYHSKKVKK